MNRIQLFTIGFSEKAAEDFFTALIDAKVQRLLDVRLKNSSHLAGFARDKHLPFFLKRIANIEYVHLPILAPTEYLFRGFKQKTISWDTYEKKFIPMLCDRKVEERVPIELLNQGCLLCSEVKASHCHRRLVAEYFANKFGNIEIVHL
jgi:uncharacterized protein (DUF488 family)